MASFVTDINPLNQPLSKLVDAFKDEVGVHLKDGNFIRKGFNQQLDSLINIRDHSRKLIDKLKAKYSEANRDNKFEN